MANVLKLAVGGRSNWVIIVSRIESGLIFPSPRSELLFSHGGGGGAHYAIKYERQRAARNYFSRRTPFFLPAAKPR